MTPVKIICQLAGPVADYAPALDSLLIELATHRLRIPFDRLPSRTKPAPDPLDVPPIPLARDTIGGWPVYRVSAPIIAASPPSVAKFGKRIDVSRAGMLREDERKVVVTSNTWTKSYRLPIKRLLAGQIVWFAVGDVAGLQSQLNECQHVGRKTSHGWGRVNRWSVEPCDNDCSWYAMDGERPVLMRTLPLCPELPENLDGWRADYGACCPPFWHVDRFTEIVSPC